MLFRGRRSPHRRKSGSTRFSMVAMPTRWKPSSRRSPRPTRTSRSISPRAPGPNITPSFTTSVVAEAAPQLGIVDDFRYESVAQVLYDVTDTPAGNILDRMGIKPGDFNQWGISLVGGKPLGI